jgi:ABC-type polysaccharide/polyol phosphate export permease
VARLVLAASVRALVGLLVVFGFAAVSGSGASIDGWLSPFVALVLQAGGSFGLGLLMAPVGTLLPGSRPTVVSALTLLTFASPILYPESLVQAPLRAALLWNPFTHLLRLYRAPIEPLPWPALSLSIAVVTGAVAVSLALGLVARQRLWWRARDLL